MSNTTSSTQITGQILHIRRLSRKLIFFDVDVPICDDGDEKNVNNEPPTMQLQPRRRQTVVLKTWPPGSPELVARANRGPDKLHAGDVVTVIGCWEESSPTGAAGGGDLAASDYIIQELWSIRHPIEAFTPVPPPPPLSSPIMATRPEQQHHRDAASDSTDSSRLPCKFFLNSGRCASGDSCRFEHMSQSAVRARLAYVGAKMAARRQRHEHEDFALDIATVQSSAKRAEIFARWIAERYGGGGGEPSSEHNNNNRKVILDVGGGRGDLSFELAVKLGLPCWTVDPRPQKFRRWQLKLLRRRRRTESCGNSCKKQIENCRPDICREQDAAAVCCCCHHDEKAAPAELPVHKQELFSRDFFARAGLDHGQVRLVVGG
jgi:hypothetical protein